MNVPADSRAAFRTLFREFFGQFFASESVTSDMRLRQALCAVLAFLITPGWMMAMQSLNVYAYAMKRAPHLIEPITRLLATMYISYSIVAIGLIAALVWENLGFDRRDAMVLGPLPVSRAVVIAAKLSAMGAFLLGASLAISLVTAVPFSVVSSTTFVIMVRNFIGLVVATSAASVVTLSAIVMLRALLGMFARGHLAGALASVLQFAFISALLCFIILLPESLDMSPRRGGGMVVDLREVPDWMPTKWFFAIYVYLRGTAEPALAAAALRAAAASVAALASAIAVTIGGYRRQLRLALTPAASAGAIGGARVSRAIARVIGAGNRITRATSDFILTTLARNRAQQAPIAINAALGLAWIVFGVIGPGRGGIVTLPPSMVLDVPMILLFWTCIGMRASFFVPSELPASWSFKVNAPHDAAGFALGTRAAMIAFVGPLAVLFSAVAGAIVGGWPAALAHAAFVALLVVALADFIVLTIDFIPFTRPYEPGFAKLKSRWPLYLLGSSGFGYGLTNLELITWTERSSFLTLLASTAAVIVIFEVAVRYAGRAWPAHTGEEPGEYETVTTLNLATPIPRQA